MSLIVLGAGKGAPGVTTTAVALAAVWPRRSLVAECDPAGADLALRLTGEDGRPLAQDRGLLSLATTVRAKAEDVNLVDHTQTAAGGLDVVVGPHTPRQAAALTPVWDELGHQLASADGDVFADCGRLTPPTVALHLARHARLLVLVVRATPAGLSHLRPLLLDLIEPDAPVHVAVLPISDRPSRGVLTQVAEVLRPMGEPLKPVVLGPLALDPIGAGGLAGEWTRHLDRTPLVESARHVAHEIDVLLAGQLTAAG